MTPKLHVLNKFRHILYFHRFLFRQFPILLLRMCLKPIFDKQFEKYLKTIKWFIDLLVRPKSEIYSSSSFYTDKKFSNLFILLCNQNDFRIYSQNPVPKNQF